MPFLVNDGVKLYYEVHGQGTPLLLTHGYSSTSAMWQGQIDVLSRDHQLIIWDMRGHGQTSYPSTPASYSEAHTLADMSALLTHVTGNANSKAIIGGLSLGGYMSLAFHAAHPERVLALLIIDTGPGFKKDSARDNWNLYAHKTADEFDRHGLQSLQSLSPERSSVTHRDATGLAHAARGMLTQRDARVINSLEGIRIPSLVLVGADDTPFLAAAEYMAKKILRARKVVVPNAGHAANMDNPMKFNEELVRFLNDIAREGKLKAVL